MIEKLTTRPHSLMADDDGVQQEMRVLHLVIDAETGGAQTLIRNLAQYKKNISHLVLVVIKGPGGLSADLERACDSVYYLDYKSSTNAIFAITQKVSRIARAEKVNILHTHLLHSDLVGALLLSKNIIRVSTVHTTGMSAQDPFRSKVIGRVVALLSRRFDKLIACSDEAKLYMKKTGYKMPKTSVIYNGVPVIKAGPINDSKSFLSLARWHPMKDHRNLFKAFAESGLPKEGWTLHCAGNRMDYDNHELNTVITANGLERSVVLHGSILNVRNLIAGSKALVLSSRYGEALPMAALESLSQGVPVVSTDVGAARQLSIDPKLVVPTGDSAALAKSMRWIAGLPDSEMKSLRQLARNKIEDSYDIRSTVSQYEIVYWEALRTLNMGKNNIK